MKMYLFVAHQVCNSEDMGIITQVFATLTDAQKYLQEFVADEKRYAQRAGWEIEESDKDFQAWEEGYYPEEHTMCEIRELTL